LSRLQVWAAASLLQQHSRTTTEARSRLKARARSPRRRDWWRRRRPRFRSPRGLRPGLRQADADALPFADESFDYVLSGNVIFHGTMSDVGRRLAESWRVLKPGGFYQDTMLSKCDGRFGGGRPVAPDIFIRGSDPMAHPHYYWDLAGLAALFAGFELLSLIQEEQRCPGFWH
jgi:tellurite methyltransferase